MALRCFLFSEDENTGALVRQILEGLGVEAESCSDAASAAETITNQAFQIVIIDWEKQPEAAGMLNSARERKAVERPLTLVIVSDDKSVPSVLQAGANSILRKPIVLNQATETLTMARDLIRAKQDSAASASLAAAAAAVTSPGAKAVLPPTESGGTLRAGEFLQSQPVAPGGHFETDADVEPAAESVSPEPVRTLKDLEPVTTSVTEQAPDSAAPQRESRGLEWYKNRLANLQPKPEPTLPPAPAPKPSGQPDLLGYDQTPAFSAVPRSADSFDDRAPRSRAASRDSHKDEAALFAYIDKGGSESDSSTGPRFRLGKRMIVGALMLAALAVAAAPQAPWHPKLKSLWSSGRQSLRAWLNPQPVTPVQAPAAHEDFARAGDEYKLPVAEPIPDATTDPSQIQVVPVIDPTAKKPNGDASAPDQSAGQSPVSSTPGDTSAPASGQTTAQIPDQPAQNLPAAQPAAATTTVVPVSSPTPTVVLSSEPNRETPKVIPSPAVSAPAPKPPAPSRQPYVPGNVPSSLKSQLAPSGDAGGNKPLDAALPSIESVTVSEAAERALLAESPAIAYPENAKGQQGTVILQVLVARDGSVQDAKFIQGSLAFARAAIEGVKQWKFKPYLMNGRAVSIQTQLTMRFNPAQ